MSECQNVDAISLPGCAPAPLSAYLKALGIFRLVAEQKDSDARGFWCDEAFVLESTLTQDELVNFFLKEYLPTPIVSPWNGGSGFFPNDAKSAIEALASSPAARFAPYGVALAAATGVLTRLGISQKPGRETKAALLSELRSALPDDCLDWFDASVVLTSGNASFPPLLGTGGNDGRLEFSNNHMQRLVTLFDPRTGGPTDAAQAHIMPSLFGTAAPGLCSGAVGQFSPGAAGGANASTGFGGDPLMTAWDFVLMLEGALMFAAAAARRLEARGSALLTAPFTVRPSGSGSGAVGFSDEEDGRAEFWAPLWSRPATLSDLQALLHEGRASVARRQAIDGLDFMRAIARLGVARGIHAFQRFGFFMRSGRTYFATPLGQIRVERNIDADLIDDLDRRDWLDRFRRLVRGDSAPARLRIAARNFEDALFEMMQKRGDPLLIQNTVVALGAVAIQLATSEARKELSERLTPPPPLSPAWIEKADDCSSEFRIAAALASLGAWPEGLIDPVTDDEDDEQNRGDLDQSEIPRGMNRRNRDWLPMAAHVVPLDDALLNPGRGPRAFAFAGASTQHVWGPGDIARNLALIAERRLLEATRRGLADKPFAGHPSLRADPADALAFLNRETDDARIAALVQGLVWIDLGTRERSLQNRNWTIELTSHHRERGPLPLAYALLKPFFTPDRDLRIEMRNPDTHKVFVALPAGASLPLPPDLIRLLNSGRVHDAMVNARRRLRAAGFAFLFDECGAAHSFDGQRLAASLLIPIARNSLASIFARAFMIDKGEADAA